MRISESWLREWVNPKINSKKLAFLLTMHGLEVTDILPISYRFNKVIVAKIIDILPHPKTKKYVLCKVSIGLNKSIFQVVCTNTNIFVGMKVAFAKYGSKLYKNKLVKEMKILGEISQGILCSEYELGIKKNFVSNNNIENKLSNNERNIIQLDQQCTLGKDVRKCLLLNDTIFNIDFSTNRSDCFSIFGMAREISAISNIKIKNIKKNKNSILDNRKIIIHLYEPKYCPIYIGRTIYNVNLESNIPYWMKIRLERSDLYTNNLITNIINYVMLEFGQPIQIFDLQTIHGNIVIRFANTNESISLNNGKKIYLDTNTLIISDECRVLSMAGIVINNYNCVKKNTKNLFIESAFFNPNIIAKTIKQYNINTNASYRFSRGVDPTIQLIALERITKLLLSIIGGFAGPISYISQYNSFYKQKKITLHLSNIYKITGFYINEDTILNILNLLNMQVYKHSYHIWIINIPLYRFDINLEIDIIEDIIRLYGYNNIVYNRHTVLSNTKYKNISNNSKELLYKRFSSCLVHRGYNEIISYSFVDSKLQDILYPKKNHIKIKNPISSKYSYMRLGLWTNLISSMIYNIHHKHDNIKIFEIGKVFYKSHKNIKEVMCVSGLLTGYHGIFNWTEKKNKFDFYDIKGDLESIFYILKIKNIKFYSGKHYALHPNKTIKIIYNNNHIGWCGVLHPNIMDILKLNNEVMLFEIKLEKLFDISIHKYEKISRFPKIFRDISFLIDKNINFSSIQNTINNIINKKNLKSIYITDIYTGDNIPKDRKSLTLKIEIQDNHKTMVSFTIDKIINTIITELENKFSIILRNK